MSDAKFQFERLGIVGVGLIGGSVARAAKSRGLVRTVVGYGRNPQRLESAQQQGVLDEIANDVAELASAELIVVCTPVDQISEDVCKILSATKDGSLVTDAGSVKDSIVSTVCREAEDAGRYIGGHPLAGSHLTGFENADSELFVGRTCVLTPAPRNSIDDIARLRTFWESIGMHVSIMSAEEHDRVLALTSHLPHLAASAVAAMVEEPLLNFAASGYRDTTRVAAGDPDLWTAIFSQNAHHLATVTDQLIDSLQLFRNALTLGRNADVKAFLTTGQQRRKKFGERDASRVDS